MKRRVWTKGLFVVLLPLLLVGAMGLAGASPAEEGPAPPHAQWWAAVEGDLRQYQPTPLEMAPQTALPGRAAQEPAAPGAVSSLAPHERMVFQDARDYNWELYAVNGTAEPVRLTGTGDKAEMHPRLAPDGQRIVFSSNRDHPEYELYTMAFNGSDVRRLTVNDTDDVNPAWSPDGQRIVFEAYRDGQPEIYVMNADGSGQARLTVSDGYDGQPVWSPDGKWIAFVSTRSGAGARLYRMDPAGGQVQMVPTPSQAAYPVWSPDSQSLAFSGDGNGDSWLEVWTVKADGSNAAVRIPSGLGLDRDLWPRSWLPVGQGSKLNMTDIGFVYWSGSWYWADAYLRSSYIDPVSGAADVPSTIALTVDAGWHPDVVSMDHTPPVFSLAPEPALQHETLWFYLRELHDVGLAGPAGYEYSWQQYPNGAWEPSKSVGAYGFEISYDPPAGVPFRARARAWDMAGNHTAWQYTNPMTMYRNELVSRVIDNRGLAVPDATITINYSTFLQVYEGEGIYHSYTTEAAPDWQSGEIRWSHSDLGSAGPRRYGGWADAGRFSFDVVLPPLDNVVVNGGFDGGTLDGWDAVGPVEVIEWVDHVYFPGYQSQEMSLSQEVTIPVSTTNPTLSFAYQLAQPEDTPFRVELVSESGTTVLVSLANHTAPAKQLWVSLAPWAGETVTLRFVREAGSLPPDVTLDDVSIGSAYPDVWVKALGEPAAWRGQTATLRLAYGNRSSLPAPDVALTWALPANLTLVEATPAPTGTAPLRWELGTLAAGGTGTIELVVAVKSAATGGLASAPATISTPHEAITGNNSTALGVWVGGKVFLPGVRRD